MIMQQKSIFKFFKIVTLALITASLVGCFGSDPTSQLLEQGSAQSQVQKRSYQSRTFDTGDKNLALRMVINSLQDLGFVIDKADNTLGSISATKFVNNVELRMTVTVRKRSQDQMLVRANARYGLKALEDAQSYQDFFTTLSKSMFLEAQEVLEG